MTNEAGHGSRKSEPVVPVYLAALIVLLGFIIRTFWLGKQELWFDEAASAFIATKSITGIISYIQGQFLEHPPVYYVLLHGWIQLTGTSEFALRYFSVILGAVFLALVWALTKPFANRTLSLCTGFIAAIFPFQVMQSQDARMYPLLACLGALSILTFYRALLSQRRWWWVAYGAVIAIGTGTHYYFLLLFMAHGTYLVLNRNFLPHKLPKWLPAVAFLSISPLVFWLAFADGPRQAVIQSFQHWTPGNLNSGDITKLGIETVFGESSLESSTIFQELSAVAILIIVGLGMLFGKREINRVSGLIQPQTYVLHTILGFSAVIPVVVGLLLPHNLVARYLTFSDAAFYLLLGLGAIAVGFRHRFLWSVPLILIATISVFGNYPLYFAENKGEFGAGTKIIHADNLPGDAIVLTHPDQWPLARYYLANNLSQVSYVPLEAQPVTDQEVKDRVGFIAANHDRIWLGPVNSWNMDPRSQVEKWLLDNTYRAFEQWLPQSTTVSLFFVAKTPPPTHLVNYRIGSSLNLLGYAISTGAVSPSGGIPIRLLWQPVAGADSYLDLVEGLRLIDGNGRVWYEMTDVIDNQPESKRALYVPPGTPPGKYRVELSIYSNKEERSLVFFDSTNKSLGAALTLGEVEVLRSNRPIPITEKASALKGVFDGDIELLGFEARDGAYLQGDKINLNAAWHSLNSPQRDYSVLFKVFGTNGREITETQLPVASKSYSPASWKAGEYVKGVYEIPIPNSLPGGQYSLQIALLDPSTGTLATFQGERATDALWGLWKRREPINSSSVTVLTFSAIERQRNLSAPNVSHPLDENFGNRIRLLGYDVPSTEVKAGEDLPFTLYWQSTDTNLDSYTVFAHLLNDKGEMVAQQDNPPQDGDYPTSQWVAGEFVPDRRLIPLPSNLPPGKYVIELGLYNSSTLERLPVLGPSGQARDNKILLPPVAVVR